MKAQHRIRARTNHVRTTWAMNPMLTDTIAIAIGAIAGAITRYQSGKVVTEYVTHRVYPNDATKQSYYLGWHTAFINITGSFLLGAIFAAPTINSDMSITSTIPAPTVTQPSACTNVSQIKSTSSHKSILSKTPTTIISTVSTLQPINPSSNIATSTMSTSTSMFALSPRSKLLLGVGFCGSYTTFSTYSVDIVSWMMQGQTNKALTYFAINNIGGIAAAAMGMTLMKKFLGTRASK